jgi:hypothetical protein
MGVDRTAQSEGAVHGADELAIEVRESAAGGLLPSDSAAVVQQLLVFGGLVAGALICTWALFSSEKISDFGTVALSFVCDKYYPIID